MRYVIFDRKNSLDDFNIVLNKAEISLPEPKTSLIELDGADGVIDLSEVLCGEVKFKNRKLTLTFTMLDNYDKFTEKLIEIANFLHGKQKKIVLSDDFEHYFEGRCTIDEFSSDKRIGKIVIKCDCEPWRYNSKETVITKNVTSNLTFDIIGQRKTICPIIKSTSSMTITFENEDYEISTGEQQVLNIQIKDGNNKFTITGNGTITMTYRGGDL